MGELSCTEIEQLLSTRSPVGLTLAEQAAVAAHMTACERCRGEWGLDEQSQVMHRAVEALRPAADLKDAVMAQVDPTAAKDTGSEGVRPAAAEPTHVGGFEIRGRLGSGGMGTVYKALQVSMDRIVALKILPPHLTQSERFVKRFLREARSAARLHHPNIVQAYDAGVADGYHYFAMEYIEGESLGDLVRRNGPLPPTRAIEYAKQVCSALTAAHKAGIVHRDIKPSNLMLDQEGGIHVTDFGLAKRIEDDIQVTTEPQVLGTPAYVSPEVAEGKEADARSDLYSLGATLFHLLAGHPPFSGRSHVAVMVKQIREAAPALAELAPHVDPRLCHLVDRLLRKDPAERYPSAQSVIEELDALGKLRPPDGAGEFQPPIPPGSAAVFGRGSGAEREAVTLAAEPPRWRSRRRALLLAAAAILLLSAVVLVARLPRGVGRRPPRPAPGAESAVRGSAAGANGGADSARTEAAPSRAQAPGPFALEFNGVDDAVVFSSAEGLDLRDCFTAEVSFRADVRQAPHRLGIILGKIPPSLNVGGTFRIGVRDDQTVRFSVHTTAPLAWQDMEITPRIELGRWYRAALQCDGKALTGYLDGVKVGESSIGSALNSDKWPITIGRDPHYGITFHGRIREVRLWHAVRTPEEMRAHLERHLEGDESGLVGYWDFREGAGDILHDRTRHKNHGSIRGAQWVTVDGTPVRDEAGTAAEERTPGS